MTNYNERLDEVLDKFGWTCVANGGDGYGLQNEDISDAKQAITSLIKELVAEAEPGTWVEPEDTDDLKWQGYVDGVIDFEQNLLKALEEK